MKRILIVAGSLALAGSLVACNPSSEFGKISVGVSNVLKGADNALARLAANDIPAACGIIGVAEGYFHQLEDRISQANVNIERKAEAAVKAICDNPPASTAQALKALFNAWMAIQNATKAS